MLISPEGSSSHGRMMSGHVPIHTWHTWVVPMLATRGWSLAHCHLCHGPDLWFAGRDGDTLLAVILVTVTTVTHAQVTHVPVSHLILSICHKIFKIRNRQTW